MSVSVSCDVVMTGQVHVGTYCVRGSKEILFLLCKVG